MLVLDRGGHGAPDHRAAPESVRQPELPRPGRELASLVAAVFTGSLGGLFAGRMLAGWLDAGSVGAMALAVGTTLTGAAHAGLVHGQSVRALVPQPDGLRAGARPRAGAGTRPLSGVSRLRPRA
jgi:hypothetical protein